MFGFTFPENFNYPYESKSITEFWHRWHISLGTWFREYVYIPLGGNRHGVGRQILNLAIVWFLTGLWHGAYYNFILWGVYYGVLLVLEKFVLKKVLDKLPAAFGHIYTMLFVMIFVAGHDRQCKLYACDVFPDRSRSCESADDVSSGIPCGFACHCRHRIAVRCKTVSNLQSFTRRYGT